MDDLFIGGVSGLGYSGVPKGKGVVVCGWQCCGVCVCAVISVRVCGADVRGVVGVCGGWASGGGFQALHCRRLSCVIVFVFLWGPKGLRRFNRFLLITIGGLMVVLGARGGMGFWTSCVLCYASSFPFFCGLSHLSGECVFSWLKLGLVRFMVYVLPRRCMVFWGSVGLGCLAYGRTRLVLRSSLTPFLCRNDNLSFGILMITYHSVFLSSYTGILITYHYYRTYF